MTDLLDNEGGRELLDLPELQDCRHFIFDPEVLDLEEEGAWISPGNFRFFYIVFGHLHTHALREMPLEELEGIDNYFASFNEDLFPRRFS